jgi:hypothetical protein
MTARTQAERITALETQLAFVLANQEETNRKLSELLALRNKGAGAFWLATTLFGTSIVSFTVIVLNWFKG